MAKLGKFSTGFGTAQPKNAPFENSNGGYERRKGLNLHHTETVKMNGRATATGKEVPVKPDMRGNPRKF